MSNSISKIYKDKNLELLKQYADKVKTGIDYFKNYKLYLASNLITCYIPAKLDDDIHIQLTNEIRNKYNRIVIFKISINGFIIPKNFEFTNNGIIAERHKKNSKGEIEVTYVKISDRWLFVKSRVYSTYHDIFQFEVESIDPVTKKTRIELCSADTLSKWSLCVSFLSNNLATITQEEYKKELCNFFMELICSNKNKITKKTTIPHMGWNDSLTEFFPYSDKLFIDYTGDTSKYLKNTVAGFKAKGNKDAFIEKMELMTNNMDSDFIISTHFAAPLLKILCIRSFSVNFYGKSGNMKSLASFVGLSVFGNVNKIRSAGNHTKNVIIEKLSKLHNLPCYVDEITDQSIDIYQTGNESGRHRLNRVGQILEAVTWRTILTCTSEASMEKDNNKAGEVNRILCIPVDCKPYDNNLENENFARTYYQFLENNYGLLGREYVDYIKNNIEAINELYKEINTRLYNKINTKTHISMISTICVANYIYRKVFYSEDNIIGSIRLGKYILSKIKTSIELDLATKMFNAIYSFYEINQAAFRKNNGEQKTNYCYGVVRDEKVYFILGPLKEYLEKQGFNWNDKKALIDDGLIEYKGARINNDKQKRIIIDLKSYDTIEREGIENESKVLKFPDKI
jgi:hypothetical protein